MEMTESSVLVDVSAQEARIRVCGRASFVFGPDLRELFARIKKAGVCQVVVEAAECASMDSTFMGVLAMAAIERGNGALTVSIANPTEKVITQLKGLGILRYFMVTEGATAAEHWLPLADLVRGLQKGEEVMRDTMIQAHEALSAANPENVAKFRQVIELLKRDKPEGSK